MPSANPVPSIFVASSNPGKITELQLGARLWSEGAGKVLNWELVFLPEFDHIPQSPEDQGSFAANAAQKALHYSRHTSAMVLADDSGLEVDWLGGAPGIFSARFAGPLATDQDNNRKLLLQMENCWRSFAAWPRESFWNRNAAAAASATIPCFSTRKSAGPSPSSPLPKSSPAATAAGPCALCWNGSPPKNKTAEPMYVRRGTIAVG